MDHACLIKHMSGSLSRSLFLAQYIQRVPNHFIANKYHQTERSHEIENTTISANLKGVLKRT